MDSLLPSLKIFWDVIREDLVGFLDEFHNPNRLSKELGATFIIMVPKADGPHLSKISGLSVPTKFYPRCLPTNLKWCFLLSSLFQLAAIEGRQVLDAVITAHECIDSLYKAKMKDAICKFDLEKAYGLFGWRFF